MKNTQNNTVHFENTIALLSHIKSTQGDTVFLAFSCGKESIASWIYLKKMGFNVIPVYLYYLLPNLNFVNESLSYYENHFQTKIYRFPHPNMVEAFEFGQFQSDPYQSLAFFEEREAYWMLDFVETFELAAEDAQIEKETFRAIGNRMNDSPYRRAAIKRYGSINYEERFFYPIFDFTDSMIVSMIKREGVKLPKDYKIWGRSFDGINGRFIKGVKEHFPNDYAKIKKAYPLIDCELKKYLL